MLPMTMLDEIWRWHTPPYDVSNGLEDTYYSGILGFYQSSGQPVKFVKTVVEDHFHYATASLNESQAKLAFVKRRQFRSQKYNLAWRRRDQRDLDEAADFVQFWGSMITEIEVTLEELPLVIDHVAELELSRMSSDTASSSAIIGTDTLGSNNKSSTPSYSQEGTFTSALVDRMCSEEALKASTPRITGFTGTNLEDWK